MRLSTAQSTMEAKLLAAALNIKDAAFFSHVMRELELRTRCDSVIVYIDNISTPPVTGYRTYSSRVKHVALRYSVIEDMIKEGRIAVSFTRQD
ncbi:unnamed protein product, partial [Sphacelaria rigidula]